MVKTFVNIIGLTCVPGYPTCACVGGSLCVCKMYNNPSILGISQIVEYKILIIYSFPETCQKILNIQELPETRRS